MHLPAREYTTLQWYEYRTYTMNNTSDRQMTIDEYFEEQRKEKEIISNPKAQPSSQEEK